MIATYDKHTIFQYNSISWKLRNDQQPKSQPVPFSYSMFWLTFLVIFMFNGLYYESSTTVIYNCNDSVQYYKTTMLGS